MAAYSTDMPVNTLLYQLALFGLGSTLLHSAACVLNDICDIEFDKLVGMLRPSMHVLYSCTELLIIERTRSRPLPSGVVSVLEAWILLLMLLLPTIALLMLTNQTT